MTSLPIATVVDVAYKAGFRGGDLVTAVAVAKAESGFNPAAYNGNTATGDNSIGLWQINMLGHLEAPRLILFGIKSRTELFEPAINAHAAFVLYRDAGHRFTDWSTYNHGSHKPFLDDAQAAVTAYFTHIAPAPHTHIAPAPHPAPGPAFTLGRLLELQPGTFLHGGDVRAVQHRLIALGYSCGPWGADGVYGPGTANAVTRFQQGHGRLVVDGKVGPATTAALGGRWTA